ncbi:MAG TPA: hypothetical protein VF502_18670 [Stellaceae bacterium]
MSNATEQVTMVARGWALLVSLQAKLGTIPLLGLAVIGLYALYVVKLHFGIDIFPDWGLHLPGPRTLIRMIARKLEP